MKLARLEHQVAQDEGFSSRPYRDSLDYWTIGYGSRWILGVPVSEHTEPITEATARTLLRAGLWKATLDAQELFPTYADLNDARQEVLVNMSYNLGFKGLAGFRRLRAAAAELNFDGMALEMINSRWYDQVGMRSQRLTAWMRSGSMT